MNIRSYPVSKHRRGRSTLLVRGLVATIVAATTIVMIGPPARAASSNRSSERSWTAQVTGYQKQLTQLRDRYLRPALLRSRYEVETRFNDAKVAYLLGDYERASILFAGLVDNRRARSLDSYTEALYLLADSLYKQRNYLAARTYLKKVVKAGPSDFYQDAVLELLEVAAKTGTYEDVDRLFASLDSGTQRSPAVNYVRGKALYRQDKYGEARRYFERAAQGGAYELRATYFRGVAFAADGQLSNANQVFGQIITDTAPDTPAKQNFVDLAYLGMGRVAYEQQKFDVAVDSYQHLKRTSGHFDEMLYELTWTLIAQKKYKAASRVTDIFLYLSNPDPTFVPKVKLLRADLQLRLQKYDKASRAYQDVVSTFSPVKQELEDFVDDDRNLADFFARLVEAEVRGEQPEYMPVMVQRWMDGSNVVGDAKQTVGDLVSIKESIESSYADLDQMEARLNSGTRIQSFPKMAEGVTLAVELESRLVDFRREMIAAQYDIVGPQMNSAQRNQWAQLDTRGQALYRRYQAMPHTKAQVEKRSDRLAAQFGTLRRSLDEVALEIDSQRDQLEAVDRYMSTHTFSGDQLRAIEDKRAEARSNLAELRRAQTDLRRQIDLVRQKVGIGDKVSASADSIRDQYRGLLARQRKLLAEVAGSSAASGQQGLAEIRAARRQLRPIESGLSDFFERMNTLVGSRTDELRQTLAGRRKMLSLLEQQVDQLAVRSKDLTAKVAYHSFLDVKRDFGDIIMRGDIGLIDVAWQKKEDMSQQINQLFEDRTAELKTLQESFDEVR